ncbi:hypothetical protein EXS73_00580 [Candidatus Pacearchaeota archaeon]|nr:hypothetical protein [Candidatus Pacearchaeota archaeon]
MVRKQKNTSDDLQRLRQEVTQFAGKIPLWVWWLLVLVFGAFVFQYTLVAMTTYTYKGLTFTIEQEGDLRLHHHAYFIDPTTRYNLYLREDPRENEVPVTGRIIYDSRRVYLSVNTSELNTCSDSAVGVGTLTSFLGLNGLKVKSASPDPLKAAEFNVTHADCTTNQEEEVTLLQAMVIILQAGEESSVERIQDRCFVLTVQNCSVIPVIEKFMVESVAQRRALGATSLRP